MNIRSVGARRVIASCAMATVLSGCTPTATGDENGVGMTALGTASGFGALAVSGQAYTAEATSDAERSTAMATRAGAARVEKPSSLFAAMQKARADKAVGTERSRRTAAARATTRATSLERPVMRRIEGNGGPSEPMGALPGVRQLEPMGGVGTLGRIKRAVEKPVRVAAAATLGRIGSHGLRLQRKNVDVRCLPRTLVATIKQAERHFGRPAVVTSGFRSPRHNRRIGGAKNSMHVRCLAADVQISGVTKWQLAKYFRSLPGRGGVGTYCHTVSVHVDVGPQRDWNWRCRRRKR